MAYLFRLVWLTKTTAPIDWFLVCYANVLTYLLTIRNITDAFDSPMYV